MVFYNSVMIAVQILSLFALGVGIGAFGTLIGVGGGFLMVPLQIILYGFEPRLVVGTSLVFVFFNTLSGSLAYLRQKRIDVKFGLVLTSPLFQILYYFRNVIASVSRCSDNFIRVQKPNYSIWRTS